MWFRTASKADLKATLEQVVKALDPGPCSTTTEQCAGCASEWYEALGLLKLGPEGLAELKKPTTVAEEPPASR